MGLASVVFVAVVLFLAGVVSGLAGFAFSAIAACIVWLLPPLQAVPLVMLLSACNQLLSISKLRQEMALRSSAEREGALPYIVGGSLASRSASSCCAPFRRTFLPPRWARFLSPMP